MIQAQHDLDPAVSRRYRPLAGPFQAEGDETILERMLESLRAAGARVLTVRETRGDVRRGISIYRLRSDCETLEETRMRIRRIR